MEKIIMGYFWAILFLALPLLGKPPATTYVVETSIIKPQQFVIERRYIGTIRAEKFSLLSLKSVGTVESINVVPGERVKKGQLLLSLNSGAEKRSLELAKKTLSLLSEDLQRNRSLFRSKDITRSQLEKSETAVIESESRMLEQQLRLENLEVRAPFDGVVGVPRVVLGETVQPGAPVVSIIDGNFFVFAHIPGSRLSEVKAGQALRIKSMQTKVASVEATIDQATRTGFLKAMLPTCPTCIVGESVYVYLTVHEKPKAIVINQNAIYYKNGKPQIVTVNKNADQSISAKIVEITLGEEQDGLVEVIAGLKESDEIVVANPKRIPEGASLRVLK